MRYDHPTFLTRQLAGGIIGAAGSGAVQGRFLAAVKTRMKRVTSKVITAGTSAGHQINVVKVSGTATSTLGTVGLSTNGTTFAGTLTFAGTAGDLLANDEVRFVNGTDATGLALTAVEHHTLPDAVINQ